MAEEAQSGPLIIVAFQNYTPPFNAEKAVRRMLRDVPAKFLHGLHTIVLTNVSALSRKERDRKTCGRRRVALGETLGYYSQEWRGNPAHITILVDNLERGGVLGGYGWDSFETWCYQSFCSMSWATTSIAFTGQSTREKRMSRTNGASDSRGNS